MALAWEELIQRYGRAFRAALRGRLRGHPDATTLIDDFFSHVYLQGILKDANEESGRFRAFMTTVIRRYAASAWAELGIARKRFSVIDDVEDPQADGCELEASEETLWAEAVLDNACRRLLAVRPQDALILFRSAGIAGHAPTSHAELRRDCGLTADVLKKKLHRLRGELRRLIIDEVADSTEGEWLPGEIALVRDRLIAARPRLFPTPAVFDGEDASFKLQLDDDGIRPV